MKASPSSGLLPAPAPCIASSAADTCPPPASVPAPVYDAFIGIDWGDQKQFYTRRDVAQPTRVHRGSFATAEVAAWLQQLRTHFGGHRIAVAVEQSRSVLIYALMEHTDFIDIYAIPTLASANYRKAFRSSGAKADNTDADAIEDMLYRHRDQLRLWQPDDEQTRLLDALCRNRRHAVDERTALTNQLTSQLKLCYPVATQLCREMANPMLLELLQRWPTLQKLQAAKPHQLRAHFYKHHVRREEWVQQRLELIAKATALVHDQAVLLPAELEVARLVRQLRTLLPAIEDYDRRIHELYEAHPDAFIFKSLPGAGPALEPRLLCALGSQRERWANAQALQNFSGLSPVRKSSGKTCLILRRHACPKYLRQTFHEFAACSIKFCDWALQFYERQCARGKSHHTAIRALAWRWVRILWRIWKDRHPYDESIFTASQKRHQPDDTSQLAPT
jgi:transposase